MRSASNRNLESNRILASVGALLVAIGSLMPFFRFIGTLAIAGAILVLVAMKGLALDFKDNRIFRNTLICFVFGSTARIFAIAVFPAVFLDFFSGLVYTWPFNSWLGFAGAVLFLVVVFLFFLLEALYFKPVFETLSDKSGEKLFRYGTLLLLIGAVLTLVLAGFVLLSAAWALLATAFFRMKPPSQPAQIAEEPAVSRVVPKVALEPAAAKPAAPSPTAAPGKPAAEQVRICPYCDAENALDAVFCVRCGRKLKIPC